MTQFCGDAREVLATLPADSVDCCVTSPPYWGLRKYAGEQELVWGGKEECDHEWVMKETKDTRGIEGSTLVGTFQAEALRISHKDCFCSLCGAWRGQLGLEPTPQLYLKHLVDIFEKVKRVLKPTGVCWVNIGDSYSGNGGAGEWSKRKGGKQEYAGPQGDNPNRYSSNGLKPKDLCLIPQRLAIALQENGWWVRSIIIWAKNNPMPESVTDRPTESHEYILMLTKSAKYYWDMEAVREKANPETQRTKPVNSGIAEGNLFNGDRRQNYEKDRHTVTAHNIRSVWTFSTQPYPDAHFATFPEELPRRCILASTSEKGNCPKCGRPWVRVVEHTNMEWIKSAKKLNDLEHGRTRMGRTQEKPATNKTLGWKPSCSCGIETTEPALVLDPFSGSGTVGAIAKSLGRKAILIEVSAQYCEMAQKRIEAVTLPLVGT